MISHHQAPAGQPGFGIGPHRHDGRGIRARGDPGGGPATDRVRPSTASTLTAMHQIPRHPSPATIDATGYDIGVYFEPGHSGHRERRHLTGRRTTASSPTAPTST